MTPLTTPPLTPLTATRDNPMPIDALGERIAELAARIHAATYELLVMLREFDEGRGWNNGFLSCAKVRAITRVATPETEQKLLDVALAGTAAHVERIVRAWRRVDRVIADRKRRLAIGRAISPPGSTRTGRWCCAAA